MSKLITTNDLQDILNEALPLTSEGYTTISNSVTQSTAAGQKTFVIPITIPDGYAFLSINRVATSYAECLINGFGWNGASNSVEVSIRNTYSGTLNCKVDVQVVCYKLSGILPSKAVDYIVEQGTSGNWTYRKWNSGVAECWLSELNVGSKAMTTQEGSGYYAAAQPYYFPTDFFIATPSIQVSGDLQGALGGCVIASADKTLFNGYWWATHSVTKTCYLNVYAKGKWK